MILALILGFFPIFKKICRFQEKKQTELITILLELFNYSNNYSQNKSKKY